MAIHAGVPFADLGMLGVDLFFVLSGFLITTLLLNEHARAGTISVPRFWGRRFLRLMPAYWLYAGGLTIAMLGFGWGRLGSNGDWTPSEYVRSLWLYYINHAPQGGIWTHQSLTLHLWSLAVEEQFYLVWPILMLLALRHKVAEPLAWGLAASILLHNQVVADLDLRSVCVRGFSIVLGCAFALRLHASPSIVEKVSRPALGVAVVWFTAVLVALGTLAIRRCMVDEAGLPRLVFPIASVGFALLIGNLWYGRGGLLAAALSCRPLVYVGKISYGMYLYHMLAHYLTWEVLLGGIESWNRWTKFGLRVATYALVTFLIAVASYHLLEKPFLILKSRLRDDPARRPETPAILAPGSSHPFDEGWAASRATPGQTALLIAEA